MTDLFGDEENPFKQRIGVCCVEKCSVKGRVYFCHACFRFFCWECLKEHKD